MASFMEDLWNSIFTPGPTPPLLLATNVTFAVLQLVLIILLFATYSIHFVVLTFLSGSLWVAINWFAKEVRIAQEREEAEKIGGQTGGVEDLTGRAAANGDDTDSEVEDGGPVSASKGRQTQAKMASGVTPASSDSAASAIRNRTAPTQLAPTANDEAIKKRRSLGDSMGDLSTDSEWEQVEDDR